MCAELRAIIEVDEDDDDVEVEDEEDAGEEETEEEEWTGEAVGFDDVKRLRRGPAGVPWFVTPDLSGWRGGGPVDRVLGPEIFPPFLPTL